MMSMVIWNLKEVNEKPYMSSLQSHVIIPQNLARLQLIKLLQILLNKFL